MKYLTWIDISRSALIQNMSVFRGLIGNGASIAPAVKANAYGHGLVEVAAILADNGADWFCVKSIEEAERLRANGISLPLLSVGYVQESDLFRAVQIKMRVGVYNREVVDELSRIGARLDCIIPLHIKVDTGMTRLGILPETFGSFVKYIQERSNLFIEGVFTHFASSDEPQAPDFFKKQLGVFTRLKNEFRSALPGTLFHSANSAAMLLYPEAYFDLVRPGIAVYGLYPSREVRALCKDRGVFLRPALSFKTRVAQIKKVLKGSKVSYGSIEEVRRDSVLAVLPVGYCDGIDRKLSRVGFVLIRGKRAKIVGRVCMNLTIVDITEISDVQLEDEVVIIGRQGDDEVSAEELADLTQTINYEITTRLSESIPRFVV